MIQSRCTSCGSENKLHATPPFGKKITQKWLAQAKKSDGKTGMDLPQEPSQFPPNDPNNPVDLGVTKGGRAHIYYDSDPKDLDAGPSAKELYKNADTADLLLSKLFATPVPQGNDPATGQPYKPAIVLVSGGGSQGAYGAYHFGCGSSSIVVDALKSDGTYTPGGDNANNFKPVNGKTEKALAFNARAVAKAVSGPADAYLSTALFVAEQAENYMGWQNKGWDCGQTNGEALSRVCAFKLNVADGQLQDTPSPITKVDGFNAVVSQQWWSDGHPDVVNDNSRSDQDTDGNGGGVMFLLYLNDYLGIPLDKIAQTGGNTLGDTYKKLTGKSGKTGFSDMVKLLSTATYASGPLKGQKVVQNGNLVLPPDSDPNAGNPFPYLAGAKSGGLFSSGNAGGSQSQKEHLETTA
jgi:hypothetical protein